MSVSGKLESILDAREARNFAGFVNLVKGFQVSGKLYLKAKKVGEQIKIIRNSSQLVKEPASTRWRPMGYDVPAAP